MKDQVLLVVVGFLLTSVAGGFLGYLFQRRTWKINRRESERQAAASVFDEISRILDRRLYRMWLLHWRLKPGTSEQRVQEAMRKYQEALVEWNDNLNRNLALAYRYFGKGVWRHLDKSLYPEFTRLGQRLEGRYRQILTADSGPPAQLLGAELKALSDEVYLLNRYLILLIQHGNIGLYQSERAVTGEPPPWTQAASLGSYGPLVAEWQRALTQVLNARISIDGRFGKATHEATIAFQNAHGLHADGVVGRETRQMMDKLLTEGVTPRRMEIGDGGLFGSLETDVMSMGSELMLGSQGERVMEWQRNLNAIGEVGLKIDGVFGERTDQATRLFQSQNDLEGDGVVGPETWRRMAELKRREVTQASSGDFDVAN